MVNYRDAVPCRNSFSVYVAPKTGWKRNTFHMNLITESNTKLFFPSFLSTKRHLCIIYHFTLKIQAWYASPGWTNTLYHISGQKKTMMRIIKTTDGENTIGDRSSGRSSFQTEWDRSQGYILWFNKINK